MKLLKKKNLLTFLYIFLRKKDKRNEEIICLFNKTLTIYNFIKKDKNLLNVKSSNDKSPEYLNDLEISYYLYGISTHLKLNMVDMYMIYHHIIALHNLNFLLRRKYPLNAKQINYIHGNMVVADFLNVISPIICRKMNLNRNKKRNIRIFSEYFFIIYKCVFIPRVFYKLNKAKKEEFSSFDVSLLISFLSMYIAIYFKVNKLNELIKNKNVDLINKFSVIASLGITLFYVNKRKKTHFSY